MSPLIGITTGRRDVQSSAGVTLHHVINAGYVDAVVRTGGVAVLLPPGQPGSVGTLVARLDGLVLSGGGDIDPAAYGGSTNAALYEVDPTRDEFEFALAREAAEQRIPTLAICRGMQVCNVALGGSLIEDIPSQVPDHLQHSRIGEHVYERHQEISLEPGCMVAEAIGTATLLVNSIHHQAVRTLAPSLRVVGRSDDGVVEALQADDDSWPLWAVQWHPEYLSQRDDEGLLLFRALTAAAAARNRDRVSA
jgi:putative glutamine amidotransferase